MYLLFKRRLKEEPRAMGSVASLRRAVLGCPSGAQHRDVRLFSVLLSHFLFFGTRDGAMLSPVPALSIGILVVSVLLGCPTSMFCQRSTGFFRMSSSRGKSFHRI